MSNPLAEIEAKLGAFATIAVKYLELKMGGGGEGGAGGGKDAQEQGAPFPSKTDPGEALSHGHRSGVRRNSAAEAASAEAGT